MCVQFRYPRLLSSNQSLHATEYLLQHNLQGQVAILLCRATGDEVNRKRPSGRLFIIILFLVQFT